MDCVNHPDTPAESYCQVCGKALCSLCIVRSQGVVLCRSCVEKTTTDGRSGWTADTRYLQQTERPTSSYVTWGYIGALAALVVQLALFGFYQFLLPNLNWTFEFYVLFREVLLWGVYFPLGVLVALGYWGLRVKYKEPFLAAGALATAAYLPMQYLIGFELLPLPVWYAVELYFLAYTGLLIAVALLVIIGLLRIGHRSVRPGLLNAVVVFKVLGLVLVTTHNLFSYFSLHSVVTLSALGSLMDVASVIGAVALVLFFGAERRTTSST